VAQGPWRRPLIGLLVSALVPAVLMLAALSTSWAPRRAAWLDQHALGSRMGAGVMNAALTGQLLVDGPTSRFSAEAQRRRAQVFARAAGDEAFSRLGEPAVGEWLASFDEPGQTVADYLRSGFRPKTTTRQVLHIQPFDDLSPAHRELLPLIGDYLEAFFSTTVAIRPALPLNGSWRPAGRSQYDAAKIAKALAARVPRDSVAVLGLVSSDLYAFRLNFVFGVGLFERRAGVHSLHRYGVERQPLTRRALKLGAHELGHMFGLEHCVFYACTMNGTNSLDELDRQPAHLCPVCHEKLRQVIGFDPATRYRRLAETYRQAGLEREATFVAARAGQPNR
jgi:archaemetzincin